MTMERNRESEMLVIARCLVFVTLGMHFIVGFQGMGIPLRDGQQSIENVNARNDGSLVMC
jgi:hypothetical protein